MRDTPPQTVPKLDPTSDKPKELRIPNKEVMTEWESWLMSRGVDGTQ